MIRSSPLMTVTAATFASPEGRDRWTFLLPLVPLVGVGAVKSFMLHLKLADGDLPEIHRSRGESPSSQLLSEIGPFAGDRVAISPRGAEFRPRRASP